MDLLFPENLPSGSISNDKELDDACLQYPDFPRGYLVLALGKPDLHRWYEEQWPKLYKYLDKDFSSRFQNEQEHLSRAWEFHIASVLFDYEFPLKEKSWDIGPDFCIENNKGGKIWIEAIACDLGNTDPVEPLPAMIPGVLYSSGGNIEETNRPRALRITNAIATKFEQYKRYLNNTKSEVSENDSLIIAVNGEVIQHNSKAKMLFKRAVFGQGPDVLVRKPGSEKFQGGYYKPSLIITKKGKEKEKEKEIPATFMEMEEFSIISVVVYSGNNIATSWLNGYKPGDDFIFAYHSKAKNPIPEGFFKFGRGVRKNSDNGEISDINQFLFYEKDNQSQK